MVKITKVGTEEQISGNLLKRNVNLFLLLFIMLIMLVGVVFVVVYQHSLRGVTEEATMKSQDLGSCSAELEATKNSLSNAMIRLNKTERDVKTYDEIYERKEGELESAQDELEDATENLAEKTARLNTIEGLYEDSKEEASVCKSDLADAESVIEEKNNRIDLLENKIDCLEDTSDEHEEDC